MVRILGRFKVREVARVARRRHDLEFAVRPALMAGGAIDGSMSARQWESIVVLLHILDRNLPSSNRVTLFAVRPQLALVNIGVTVLAAFTHIRKDHFYVARSAG